MVNKKNINRLKKIRRRKNKLHEANCFFVSGADGVDVKFAGNVGSGLCVEEGSVTTQSLADFFLCRDS